ncbi:MAG: PEGA domain-containing protein [Deltaproteobacteria bacterium]|nr:PEGA domain-containing protein [Deltaproteobacteria bacterium]
MTRRVSRESTCIQIALGACTFLAAEVAGVQSVAAATRVVAIVRGVGAGSDKAAGFVEHFVGEALAKDERYELVDLAKALGDTEAARVKRAFEVAQEMTEKGRSAYETLDLDLAVDHLNSALAKYERHAGSVTDVAKVAEVLMLLGASHILRGEEKTGAKRLGQAIAIHSTVEPDPRIFNPGMREIFQKASEELAKRPTGSLSLSSNPSYARVFVDGKFVGVTPAIVDKLSEGRHFVRLVKAGFAESGKVIEVVGGHEASGVETLKESDAYAELDALAEAALPALPNKRTGDSVGEVFRQLGVLLDADMVLMAEVRLDGERVRVLAVQVDVNKTRVLKSASQVFSYDSRPETFEREIAEMFRAQFESGALAAEVEGGGKLGTVGAGDCYGMPCPRFKQLALTLGVGGGGGLVLLGGLLDYLAYLDNKNYRETPQTSNDATSLRKSGTVKAVMGDILITLGLATAATGFYLWYFWTPSTAPQEVLKGPGKGAQLMVLPLDQGVMVGAEVRF